MDSTHKHNILKYSTTVYAIIPQLATITSWVYGDYYGYPQCKKTAFEVLQVDQQVSAIQNLSFSS